MKSLSNLGSEIDLIEPGKITPSDSKIGDPQIKPSEKPLKYQDDLSSNLMSAWLPTITRTPLSPDHQTTLKKQSTLKQKYDQDSRTWNLNSPQPLPSLTDPQTQNLFDSIQNNQRLSIDNMDLTQESSWIGGNSSLKGPKRYMSTNNISNMSPN